MITLLVTAMTTIMIMTVMIMIIFHKDCSPSRSYPARQAQAEPEAVRNGCRFNLVQTAASGFIPAQSCTPVRELSLPT